MRKALLATASLIAMGGSAFAADLPNVKGPPVFNPPPPPAFSWTGFYIGGKVGYAWGGSTTDLYENFTTPPFFLTRLNLYRPTGIIGGGYAGYNFQWTQFVFGVEGDIEDSSFHGSSFAGPFDLATLSTRIGLQGSVRGRVGYAWDRLLFYGTGGVSFASITNGYSVPIIGFEDSFQNTRAGWTVGGGLEYAITNNFLIRGEARHSDYGHTTNDFSPFPFYVSKHVWENEGEIGLAYKFDWFAPPVTPVVAKY